MLLCIKLRGRKGALSTGLGMKADATCVGRTVIEKNVRGTAETGSNHARDSIVIKRTADVELVKEGTDGMVVVIYIRSCMEKHTGMVSQAEKYSQQIIKEVIN